MNKNEENIILEAINNRFQYPDLESLKEADHLINQIVVANPGDLQASLAYNEFRIANIAKLPKTRPQILIGSALQTDFPNFNIIPLLEIADVICITTTGKPSQLFSTISCQPTTQFLEILTYLPEGFAPDFYWDHQIENLHFIPPGIEKAPFPIIASVFHASQHQTIEYICELFDLIIPLSKSHGKFLKKKYPNKIIDIPFGLNLGSFEYFMKPLWDKEIDVCLTFSSEMIPKDGDRRLEVIELVKQFNAKYRNEFLIEITSKLSKEEYIVLLQKSRIMISVLGVDGPYNYDTMEAMNTGAMVFQYESKDHFLGDTFTELFTEGVHGVTFNFDNFESKLLDYLRNPAKIEQIAKEAYAFQKDNYNYKKLYLQLFEEVKKSEVILPRTSFKLMQGLVFRDLAYYYQNNFLANHINFGLLEFIISPRTWLDFNNIMIYMATIPPNSFSWNLLVAMTEQIYSQYNNGTLKALYRHYYESALNIAPAEYIWIVKWNNFMISVETNTVLRNDAEYMLSFLNDLTPAPFDETGLFFKYYVHQNSIPAIELGECNLDYQEFNTELLKYIDNPQKRAFLYRDYAIKKVKDLLI